MEPHKVNPPVREWLRLGEWDSARARKRAREAVEKYGLDKCDHDTRRLYNDLILEVWKPPDNG